MHVFYAGTFGLGRLEAGGWRQEGRAVLYQRPGSTVVDAFRPRHVTGYDMAFAALSRPVLPQERGASEMVAICRIL